MVISFSLYIFTTKLLYKYIVSLIAKLLVDKCLQEQKPIACIPSQLDVDTLNVWKCATLVITKVIIVACNVLLFCKRLEMKKHRRKINTLFLHCNTAGMTKQHGYNNGWKKRGYVVASSKIRYNEAPFSITTQWYFCSLSETVAFSLCLHLCLYRSKLILYNACAIL